MCWGTEPVKEFAKLVKLCRTEGQEIVTEVLQTLE